MAKGNNNKVNREEVINTAAQDATVKAKSELAHKAAKAAKTAAQQQKWLSNAKVDENGKYQIMVDPDLDNRGDHKSWAPYAWIITNDCKRIRISWKFAKELAQSDKAIEISKDGLKELTKAA